MDPRRPGWPVVPLLPGRPSCPLGPTSPLAPFVPEIQINSTCQYPQYKKEKQTNKEKPLTIWNLTKPEYVMYSYSNDTSLNWTHHTFSKENVQKYKWNVAVLLYNCIASLGTWCA